MESDLVVSLKIAKKILKFKKAELKLFTEILQENAALSDELICLIAEFCNVIVKQIDAIENAIISLNEQISIFGKYGLTKELEIIPKEEYPASQQPENI